MARRLACLALLLGLLAWAPAASAEEAKTPIDAPMLLSIMTRPAAPRVSVLDESLRDPGPAPRAVEPSPVTIAVGTTCLPGDLPYAPPPPPGRRARY